MQGSKFELQHGFEVKCKCPDMGKCYSTKEEADRMVEIHGELRGHKATVEAF